MTCTVSDTILDLNGSPLIGASVYAVPDTVPLFLSGIERQISHLHTLTDAAGRFSLPLPWPSVCDPATVKWQVVLPDSVIWKGASPEGITGPLTLKELKDTYAWGLISGGSTSTIVAVQGPPGTGNTISDATTATPGVGLIDVAASGAHPVFLTRDGLPGLGSDGVNIIVAAGQTIHGALDVGGPTTLTDVTASGTATLADLTVGSPSSPAAQITGSGTITVTPTSTPGYHSITGSMAFYDDASLSDTLDVVQSQALWTNNGNNALWVNRRGALNGYDYTDAAAVVQDDTASTAPLLRISKQGAVAFRIGPAGQIETNQAATHTLGTYSGNAIPIYSASGTLLGWLPLYA